MFTMYLDFYEQTLTLAHIPHVKNEPMAQKTTFKVGGNASLYVTPQNVSQFQSAVCGAAAAELPFFVLGGGSNVVFPDGQYNGAIISTTQLSTINTQEFSNDSSKVLVTCLAGTPTAAFVRFCTEHCFSGAEQFAGLPGSIGGAVYMNARCFEKSISDLLYQTEHVEFTNPSQSKIVTLPFCAEQWAYKKSPFQTADSTLPTSDSALAGTNQPKKYITSATFLLSKLDYSEETKNQLENECKKYIAERVNKGHFKFPSAGSVFKNNHDFGKPSGKIIDEVGLRGFSIGGAQVAPFHGNFIINTGNASANDIQKLVKHVQEIVQSKTGFMLEPEIVFIQS